MEKKNAPPTGARLAPPSFPGIPSPGSPDTKRALSYLARSRADVDKREKGLGMADL